MSQAEHSLISGIGMRHEIIAPEDYGMQAVQDLLEAEHMFLDEP